MGGSRGMRRCAARRGVSGIVGAIAVLIVLGMFAVFAVATIRRLGELSEELSSLYTSKASGDAALRGLEVFYSCSNSKTLVEAVNRGGQTVLVVGFAALDKRGELSVYSAHMNSTPINVALRCGSTEKASGLPAPLPPGCSVILEVEASCPPQTAVLVVETPYSVAALPAISR